MHKEKLAEIERMQKDFQIEIFEENLFDYSQWAKKGDWLHRVSKSLEHHLMRELKRAKEGKVINYHPVSIYYMLTSFAIENLLKAVIVKKNKEKLRDSFLKDHRLPKILNSHNLIKLSEMAGCTNLDVSFLFKLGENAVWRGRYPVPISPEGYSKMRASYTSFDPKWIKETIKKIKNELNKNL